MRRARVYSDDKIPQVGASPTLCVGSAYLTTGRKARESGATVLVCFHVHT